MLAADRNSRVFVTRSQIIVDAAARLSTLKSRLARSAFSRNFLTHFSHAFFSRIFLAHFFRAPNSGRRLPHVPLQTIALEPEQ